VDKEPAPKFFGRVANVVQGGERNAVFAKRGAHPPLRLRHEKERDGDSDLPRNEEAATTVGASLEERGKVCRRYFGRSG
jgi:hypothetical protein